MMRDPEKVTAQYGIFLTTDDMVNDEFKYVLDKYIGVAFESINQASKRKKRDWSVFEQIIK
jgi:hypothetical protein